MHYKRIRDSYRHYSVSNVCIKWWIVESELMMIIDIAGFMVIVMSI